MLHHVSDYIHETILNIMICIYIYTHILQYVWRNTCDEYRAMRSLPQHRSRDEAPNLTPGVGPWCWVVEVIDHSPSVSENHRKTTGKWWFHVVLWWFNWDFIGTILIGGFTCGKYESWDDEIPILWKKKTCSKPPTRIDAIWICTGWMLINDDESHIIPSFCWLSDTGDPQI